MTTMTRGIDAMRARCALCVTSRASHGRRGPAPQQHAAWRRQAAPSSPFASRRERLRLAAASVGTDGASAGAPSLQGGNTLVKICGVVSPDDASHAAASGADFVGCILSEGYRRSVDWDTARAIVQAAREGGAEPVGVFTRETDEEIVAACEALDLRTVQLHGDVPRQSLKSLPHRLRVFYVVVSRRPPSRPCSFPSLPSSCASRSRAPSLSDTPLPCPPFPSQHSPTSLLPSPPSVDQHSVGGRIETPLPAELAQIDLSVPDPAYWKKPIDWVSQGRRSVDYVLVDKKNPGSQEALEWEGLVSVACFERGERGGYPFFYSRGSVVRVSPYTPIPHYPITPLP